MIESMRCSVCGGCFTNTGGKRTQAYRRSIQFKQKGGKWRPECSDKEACASQVLLKCEPEEVFFPARKKKKKEVEEPCRLCLEEENEAGD